MHLQISMHAVHAERVVLLTNVAATFGLLLLGCMSLHALRLQLTVMNACSLELSQTGFAVILVCYARVPV
jgi:hypothetical protein